jgi:putative ABC transport system substrate-binding protein
MALVRRRVTVIAYGLVVPSGALITSQRAKIVELAARHAIPTIYAQREFVDIGGDELWRQFPGRISTARRLHRSSAKFEFIINLRTVKALGFEFPPTLLATADEVIE